MVPVAALCILLVVGALSLRVVAYRMTIEPRGRRSRRKE